MLIKIILIASMCVPLYPFYLLIYFKCCTFLIFQLIFSLLIFFCFLIHLLLLLTLLFYFFCLPDMNFSFLTIQQLLYILHN